MKKIFVVSLLLAVFFTAHSQSQFSGNVSNNRIDLSWTIDANEATGKFEVERSFDGKNFKMAALVFTSEKNGKEDYKYFERLNGSEKIYYRIKRFYDNEKINYSQVICLTLKDSEKYKMDL